MTTAFGEADLNLPSSLPTATGSEVACKLDQDQGLRHQVGVTPSIARRQLVLGVVLSLALTPEAQAQMTTQFPPMPSWRPSFAQPIERVVERFRYYTNGTRSFAVFENSTCAVVANDLSEEAASEAAIQILSSIINYHPDMTPNHMDDGNVLVSYRQPAFNVVLSDVAQAHWSEINQRHQEGLTPDEVLITPLG